MDLHEFEVFEEKYGYLLESASNETRIECFERYKYWEAQRKNHEEIRNLTFKLRKETYASYLVCQAAVIESKNNYEEALKIVRIKIREEQRKWSPFI